MTRPNAPTTQWALVALACTLLVCVTALVMHKDLPIGALVAGGAALFAWFLRSPLATPLEQAVIAYVEAHLAELQTKEAPGLAVPEASDSSRAPSPVTEVREIRDAPTPREGQPRVDPGPEAKS